MQKDHNASLLPADPLASPTTTEPLPQVGDIVVSKFGNRWKVVATGDPRVNYVVLHNVPPECPDAVGTMRGGEFPEWAERIERNGLRVWQRPTPKCECPSYTNSKGPYPSGFCPDCGKWYPGIDRATALARGHITGGGETKRECSCVGFCKGRDGLSSRYICAVEGRRGKIGSGTLSSTKHSVVRAGAQREDHPDSTAPILPEQP